MINFKVEPHAACWLPSAKAFRVVACLLFLLLTFRSPCASASGEIRVEASSPSEQNNVPTQDKIRVLGRGEILRQMMKGGETHSFQLSLSLNQYAEVVVEQQGIDVIVRMFAPDGRMIVEVDSPNGLLGPETVSVIAQAAGNYRIEVLADKTMPGGSYELRVEGPREQTVTDAQRVEAERLFMEAQKLRIQGTQNSRTQALARYKETVLLWRAQGDARREAYALCSIGRVYRAMGMLTESLDYFNRALRALQSAQDIAGQAFVLNETATAYRNLSDPLLALNYYDKALALRTGIGDLWGQAQVLNNIGYIYFNTGRQQKAVENYGKALPLWQSIGDRYMEANTLNNIAEAYSELGDLSSALEEFQRVLKFCEETGNSSLEAFVRNNIGKIYDTWADSQAALQNYQAALDLFRRLKNSGSEAMVLENIGMVYTSLDDAERARQYFQDALEIRQQLNERRGLAIALNNLGYAEELMGNYQEALKYLNLSLPHSRTSRNRPFEAYSLVNIGMAYMALGNPQKALDHYQQALEIQNELEDRRGQAITLDKIGQAQAISSHPSKALESYRQALQRWVAVGDRQGQALSLYGIAKFERNRNNLREARDRIEEAISIIESLRGKLPNHQLRMIYFAAKQDYYELDIDIRMRLYELTRSEADMHEALSINERGRARNLLDLLAEAHANIKGSSSPLVAERSNQIEQEISSLMQSLLRLRNLKRVEDVSVVEARLSKLATEHDELQAEIRAASASYTELSQPQPLSAKQVQQLLNDNTLLLEYRLGEERSYLWAVTESEITAYTLPGRSKIEKTVDALRETLAAYEPPRAGESDQQYLDRRRAAYLSYQQQSSELSSMLVRPVSSKIGSKRLVIVADGALQYVPFGALPLPVSAQHKATANSSAHLNPLILRHEVVYQPSASALALLRSAPHHTGPKTLAVLADPVFDMKDKRMLSPLGLPKAATETQPVPSELKRALRDVGDVGSSDFKLEPLPYAAQEADAITNAAPPGSWMKAVGFQASRATAQSAELSQFKIVHFATHSILNNKHPELSGIVLSMFNQKGQLEDGFLRLGDIYNLNLPVDLVVLSACRTGIGKQVRGEGLIGLTRGFMYAGASRVVASLWKVDDEATAELMKRFYQNMLEKKMPPAAALRQSQIDMMGLRDQWRAPYYWAGFILQGEWK